MRKLLVYMKDYKKESFLAPLFKLLEATFELIVPLVIAQIIDVGIQTGDTGFIISRCLLLVGFGVVGMVSAITAQYFAAKAAVGFATGLRHSLFQKINELSFSLLDRVGTSTLLTRITNDVNQVQNGVNLVLRLFMRSPFIVFGACVMAFTIDPGSALLFLIVVALLSVVVFGIMLLTIKRYKAIQNQLDSVLNTTRENLNGARVIRAFCGEDTETEKFIGQNSLLSKLQKSTGRISALLNPVTFILINVGIILLIHYGAVQVNTGILTQGQVVALYNYMSQILVELIKLANLIITVTKSFASAARIRDVLELDTNTVYSDDKKIYNTHAVEFDRVSMHYNEGAKDALENISFTAEPGQTTAIIGSTGCGKSTLLNLIPRFYDTTGGRVTVDGIDVRDMPQETLHSLLGYVPQKGVLFSGTIESNLKFGGEQITDADMKKAASIAQAEEFISTKPDGYASPIAQGGSNVSGGQKQRLSIARAIAKDPRIYLFDDSFSALDYRTDVTLRRALKAQTDNATVIIVAQRISTVLHANQILVLDEGRLVGVGTHAQLMASCPEYQEIARSQLSQKELDLKDLNNGKEGD